MHLCHSRFYGPIISTLPLAIQPWVAAYERSISISLENTGDNPFLFSLQSAWDRGMSSSQWTSTVHTPLVLNGIVPSDPMHVCA